MKIGDRVRLKAEHLPHPAVADHWVGTVASVPTGPIVLLAGHLLGHEVSIICDTGGTAVADASWWEPA